jgi:hypothetical protein
MHSPPLFLADAVPSQINRLPTVRIPALTAQPHATTTLGNSFAARHTLKYLTGEYRVPARSGPFPLLAPQNILLLFIHKF